MYSWMLSFLIFGAGFALSFISFFWWVMIGMALWAYTVGFLLLAPILSNSGMDKVWQEFKNHRVSMTVIFIVLMLVSAKENLDPNIFKGISIASIFILLKQVYNYKYS